MSHAETDKASLPLGSIIVAGVLVILVAVLYFWRPAEPEKVDSAPIAQEQSPVAPEVEEPVIQPEPETTPEPVEAEPPINAEPEPIVEATPAQTVPETDDKSLFEELKAVTLDAAEQQIARLVVSSDLFNRLVVQIDNIANQQLANNHRLFKAPQGQFQVYQQADRLWIDAQSYQRYDGYVALLDAMDNQQLIAMYQSLLPAMQEKYAEIGSRRVAFEDVLMDAVEHLLATPEVPTPIEVKTESVMYQFADERIEALSPVQKQLIRMGPENMRRVKVKLRQLRALLTNQ
ncbi:DUF3014 domain-containing protein [Bowmanella sp. JS7-9]|uniref:DUF3014 domain-containing protein n=1 Tax=Pseudobowmanella zhangzhouensis TaxID=1537679 RepID=A0ABW1XNF8_9ALTE|nr:DUF3014 domain-containing protein [Bowmanella sp. JS7-9]TBX23603.1 hypothetical protein TK45_05660 [Bowmanella sp. JS7-9]